MKQVKRERRRVLSHFKGLEKKGGAKVEAHTNKMCKKCGQAKSIAQFYVHRFMADGYLNICKECVKKRVKEYREKNVKGVREYDRKRNKTRSHNKEYRKLKKKAIAKYRKNHPISSWTLKQLYKMRPDTCGICKKNSAEIAGKIQAHHPDYDYPEQVEWLCPICHARADKERRLREKQLCCFSL